MVPVTTTRRLRSRFCHGSSWAPSYSLRPRQRGGAVTKPRVRLAISKPKPTTTKRNALREEEPLEADRECVICAETKHAGRWGENFPRFTDCKHAPMTCSDCVTTHAVNVLKTAATVFDKDLGTSKVDWSKCSCPQCGVRLNEEELSSKLSRSRMASLRELATQKALESNPRWMQCLSSTCSAGWIVAENRRKRKVKCPKCEALSCLKHRVPWHEGYTCSQYDDYHPSAESSRKSLNLIKRIGKRCPQPGCGWWIEKDGGCSHMICEYS